MDEAKIIEALRGTTKPDEQEMATKYLDQATKIIGFAPTLLRAVMDDNLDPSVRQAGVIFLKNLIIRFWDKEEAEEGSDPVAFTIHEQDRHIIRENIVEAIIHSPEPIRVQLAVCVTTILRHDFPARWSGIVQKISSYLEKLDGLSWMGALTVLYRLVKIYEYRKPKEKKPLVETMRVLLPMLQQRLMSLMPDASQESVLLQKLIMKIFFALVQFSLNFDMISKESFVEWMELCRQIVGRPVPDETKAVSEEDRPELVWWKCKKWAIHTMSRVFERYGSPGQVQTEYNQFAEYYLKQMAAPSIETVLHVLDEHRKGEYVSPRVLHQCLLYLQSACSHAFSWKVIKPHMSVIVNSIIFPLLKHSDEDEEMWEDDPQEFIKFKYDIFDDLMNPSSSAAALLTAAVKRQGQLPKTLEFIVQVLNSSQDPRDQDGALHMVGTLAPNLLKKKLYKKDLEKLLEAHVLPRIESPYRFLRARSCWSLQSFSETPFSGERVLSRAVDLLIARLTDENEELPVKVEAALAIQMFLADQKSAQKLLRPHVQPVILEVLKLVARTEIDDLTTVMDRLIETFMNEVIPIAVQVSQELANIFAQFLNAEDGSEDRSITAMGILNTLESILAVMEDHKEIMVHLEEIVRNVIQVVIQQSVMDFYEEIFSLVQSLTTSQISEPMWHVYGALVEMFKTEGVEYFTDMMPALHNYVTVDTDAFLARPERLDAMFQMCSHVLKTPDVGDDAQTHAAKLLEVVILQCKGRIDPYIRPIAELVLSRLTGNVHLTELRTMCLQVVIAGLHYNPVLMLQTLAALQPADSPHNIIDTFVKQMLYDTDCFLGVHDRKLCLIGFCTLLALPVQGRPGVMAEVAGQIVPSCLLLFEGLQKALQAQAEQRNADSDDENSDEEAEERDDGLASDEDEIDEATLEYLETINKAERDSGNGNDGSCSHDDDDDSDDEDFVEETDLEAYDTPLDGENSEIDEFLMFHDTLA
uniref:Importin N-terminal domain-containing protein n=1 Tax=Plectus sambesii TaxID=2011161 RepID=A0A914X6W2_9BILA